MTFVSHFVRKKLTQSNRHVQPGWVNGIALKTALKLILVACLLSLSSIAQAALNLLITESAADSVQIEVVSDDRKPGCVRFPDAIGILQITKTRYRQPLNSEVGEEAEYLVAARQGGGIYLYLPSLASTGTCTETHFTIKARHILWNGRWHTGSIKINAASAAGSAVFFTNEASPNRVDGIYMDSQIPSATAERLRVAFKTILAFYSRAFGVEPLKGVGVVVAISHNKGGYSGFGGDSLNIIRMSYDNPKPEHWADLDRVFPATFAHELAHKLQSDSLFSIPQGRYISEGSADFLKVVVVLNAGLIDAADAKARVAKALSDCAKLTNSDTMESKIEKRTQNYREPYDCGMAYYFAAYYASDLSDRTFLATLLKALSGSKAYSAQPESLCLLYESHCSHDRLRGLVGDKSLFQVQADWLASQLATRPLPSIQ